MEDDLNSPTPQPKPPSLPCPLNRPTASEMEELSLPSSDEAAAAVWEWGSLLDFSIDDADPLILPWAAAPEISPIPSPPPPPPPLPPPPAAAAAGPKKSGSRVRKRDPRLVCENYLAGRVPCACPEMDEMEAEEEEEVVAAVAGGRVKRTRGGGGGGSAAVAAAATARCQVPGCEADIRELKGYHRRHRVCLRCANAASVMLDGEPKRYCQQCGKFHILTDFDEGKRSCRRKLERHNKRRRRRPDFRSVVEQETQSDMLADASCDGEPKEELTNGFACDTVETVVSNKVVGRETQPQSEDGRGSPVCSLPNSQNVQSNSVVSFTASAEAHTDERIDNSKSAFSSTFGENKSTYSSVCPTGRISFKLYDWNPAEFPRRLRHQIFQWLANMPVELEGYIRPGCTILTAFIAMPQFMWEKITDDAAGYVSNLVNGPESLFMGRGNIFIYLSNMIIHVLKDGTLLTNIKMEVKAPRLHYVHPAYFEVGKPVELFACGSNLDQPKFRFLVSFAGKYLNYDSCCHISHGNIQSYEGYRGNSFHSSEHEMLRVCIKHIDPKLAGPAFVEVENESGVSNFIPIIFGSKSICSELERIQRASTESLCTYSVTSQNAISVASAGLCGQLVSGQSAVSELLVDMAWLLKQPCLDEREAVLTSVNIQRLTCLLKYSIQNELFNILEVILHYVEVVTGGAGFHSSENMDSGADLKLLVEYMNHAREIHNQRAEHDIRSEVESESLSLMPFMQQSYVKSSSNCTTPMINEDAEACSRYGQGSSVSEESDECIPLISNEVIHRNHCYPKLRVGWPREPWANIFLRKVTGARHGVFITVSLAMCFGACIILLHPHKAGEVAASMRRCVFGDPIG